MVTGRPGPVVLDVPFDIFKEAAAEETPKPEDWNANISSRCGADPDGVTKAVDLLLAAERPVILVGQGVKYGGAGAELLQLAERLRIPVAWSASGTGAIDSSASARARPRRPQRPLSGQPRRAHGRRAARARRALRRPHVELLAARLFVHDPADQAHPRRHRSRRDRPHYPVELGLMADVRTFLRQMLAELESRRGAGDGVASRAKWLGTIDGWRKEWNAFIAPGFVDDATPSIRNAPPTRSTRRCRQMRSW